MSLLITNNTNGVGNNNNAAQTLNEKIASACGTNRLPSYELLTHAYKHFNIFNDPNNPFQPSREVKQQLYYAAHSKLDENGSIILGDNFNYTNLSASDTAALFHILNSFQAYEKEKKGELAIFSKVVFYFEQYILRICHRDEEKARRVLDALISYNNPSNDGLIQKMRSSITAIAKTNRAHNSTGQNQFSLPEDIWLDIFKNYLSPKDLGRVAQVCKQFQVLASRDYVWNAIENRLPSIYPSLRVIGSEAWREYVDLARFGLSLEEPVSTEEGAAPGSKRASMMPILTMLHQVALKVEGEAGLTLLTIPEGLTFNKLVEIAGSPKQGNPTGFDVIWDRITEELGDIPVTKTYRVVITNNVLIGSRNKSFADQEKLAEDLGCELPGVLEASTLCILTNIIFSTRLLGNTPWTYTRCWQEIGGFKLVVGGFAPDVHLFNYNFVHADIGALVLRKFPVIGT